MPQEPSVTIRAARLAERPIALELALSSIPPTQRTAAIATARLALAERAENLLVALRATGIVGAVWGAPQPGGFAEIWPARLVEKESRATAVELMRATLASLRTAGVHLAQALIPPTATADAELFAAAGMEHAGNIAYLSAPVAAGPPPAMPLHLTRYRPEDHSRLCSIVERSYIGSHDFAALNGVRSAEDAIASYRATGEFHPELWLLARDANQPAADVGCVLLAMHPDQRMAELVYMGLVPEARGKGLGSALVAWARHIAAEHGAEQLALAVDVGNRPATSMYRRQGFTEWQRRSAWIYAARSE